MKKIWQSNAKYDMIIYQDEEFFNCGNSKMSRLSEGSEIMENKGHTQFFKKQAKEVNEARLVLEQVYKALEEKGYNPTYQLVGYLISGDPTYVTGHNDARKLISRLERDELLEEMVNFYFSQNKN